MGPVRGRAGAVAQLLAAVGYLGVVHRRLGHVAPRLAAVSAPVVSGLAFFALHPDSLAGLSERLLFVASALWMLTSVQVAPSQHLA